jgi:cytochrome c5
VPTITRFRLKYLCGLSCLIGLLLCASGELHGQAAPSDLPPGNGRELVAVACSQCHGLKLIVTLRDSRAGWKRHVDEMVLRGTQLLPEEADTVVQYLAKNFGPGAGPMQSSPGASEISLPKGPGQDLVDSRCTLCHDLGRITTVRRTKEEWDHTVRDMLGRLPKMPTPEELQTMTSYLNAQFGKKAE